MKTCILCGQNIEELPKKSKYCVPCKRLRHNEVCREYNKKHKKILYKYCKLCNTKFKANSNRQVHCQKCIDSKAKNRFYDIQRLYKYPNKNLFYNAKRRAKTKNLEFSITLKDIQLPKSCPVLGIPLYIDPIFNNGKKGRGGHGYSIDRINLDKVYTKDNICIISDRANRLKSDATIEELEKILDYMKKNIKDVSNTWL
jgi:hypothetical protein